MLQLSGVTFSIPIFLLDHIPEVLKRLMKSQVPTPDIPPPHVSLAVQPVVIPQVRE